MGRKGTFSGEVRFETAEAAAQAVESLNGCEMAGGEGALNIVLDPTSKDGTKLIVTNVPPGAQWQELKDHFAQIGQPVIFCNVKQVPGGDAAGAAEVRYDDPQHAQLALQTLNGIVLQGSTISITAAPGSQDGSKLLVIGLNPATQWQELKDHFAQCGQVAFANVLSGAKGSGGKGMQMNPMMQMMANMLGMGGGWAWATSQQKQSRKLFFMKKLKEMIN